MFNTAVKKKHELNRQGIFYEPEKTKMFIKVISLKGSSHFGLHQKSHKIGKPVQKPKT